MCGETVTDQLMNPRNQSEMENPDGIARVDKPKCGDIMKSFIRIHYSLIDDVKFMTFGCAAAVASSSMETELIKRQILEKGWDLSIQAVTRHPGSRRATAGKDALFCPLLGGD